MNVKIEKMTEDSFSKVMEIHNEVFHGDLAEDQNAIKRKFELYPEGCIIAVIDDVVVGYIIAHPWSLSKPPGLSMYIEELPEHPECLYLHDAAVSKKFASQGIGELLLNELITIAKKNDFNSIAAVAVMTALAYWKKHSFYEVSLGEKTDAEILKEYGDDSSYIRRKL